MKERTSLGSFLQWPDLICRNGAARGWRQGMVLWCKKNFLPNDSCITAFIYYKLLKLEEWRPPWQPMAGGTILSTEQGFYSLRR